MLLGPRNEPIALPTLRVLDAGRRVDLHKLRLRRPAKQPAHGIEKMPGLCRRLRPTLASGAHRRRVDLGEGLAPAVLSTCRKMFSRCLRVASDSTDHAAVSRYRAISQASVPVDGAPLIRRGVPDTAV